MPRKQQAAAPTERLHVRIARSGLCSRRAAEKLISEGRVSVNGDTVRVMGVMVCPEDEVHVDTKPISVAKMYTLLLNKPRGVVTTLSDPQGRPTIVRLLPDYGVQLKPVGRLDMDTEGLLLVTNDGELANRLAHPRYGIEKEYLAVVRGIPDERKMEQLRKGVFIEGRKTSPATAIMLKFNRGDANRTLKFIIHEGRKRQVRNMCEFIGHPVISLKRTRLGPLILKGLRPGECRLLGQTEVAQLQALVGLAKGASRPVATDDEVLQDRKPARPKTPTMEGHARRARVTKRPPGRDGSPPPPRR